MTFKSVSFVNRDLSKYYVYTERFNLSKQKDVFEAIFYSPDLEHEPVVHLDVDSPEAAFRFKVRVNNVGTFVFFFANDQFGEKKQKLFQEVKTLRDIQDNDFLKTRLLIRHVVKFRPLVVAYYDEGINTLSFHDFRKIMMWEHVFCPVILFSHADIGYVEPVKAKKENGFSNDIKAIAKASKKAAHGIKVASIATGHFVKKAAVATGHFFKKVGHGIKVTAISVKKAAVWFYKKVMTPVGHAITIAAKATYKYFLKPVGLGIWKGLKFVGKLLAKFGRWVGRGISKVSPKLLPFLGRVCRTIGRGFKKLGIWIWIGIKWIGKQLGCFFKWFGPILWKGIKWIGRQLWRFIKWLGRLLKRFFIWLGKKLKILFIKLGRWIKKSKKYYTWKNDYTFYGIFALLFSFGLFSGICEALNEDSMSVFFFVLTPAFLGTLIYATYMCRRDDDDWKVTVKNTLTANIAVFVGLTLGIVVAYFASKGLIKLEEGQTLDYSVAVWVTIGVSLFALVLVNFTPFIIHHYQVKQKESKKVDEQPKVEPKPEEVKEEVQPEQVREEPVFEQPVEEEKPLEFTVESNDSEAKEPAENPYFIPEGDNSDGQNEF